MPRTVRRMSLCGTRCRCLNMGRSSSFDVATERVLSPFRLARNANTESHLEEGRSSSHSHLNSPFVVRVARSTPHSLIFNIQERRENTDYVDAMESLIDSFQTSKWMEMDVSKKQGFKEYHVMRRHHQDDATHITYCVAVEDGDPMNVKVEYTQVGHDPLKGIGCCELKLDDKGENVIGIDLNGDCVVHK
ncbi:hypothetical protein ScPMuIL_017946 [Solemya velum]